jgi:hypothetical protein
MPTYRYSFISHAHADNDLCDPYSTALAHLGIPHYYDRQNPQVGHSLSLALQQEIERAANLIVMVSPASLVSFWVNEEIDMFFSLMAKDRSRRLIPIKIAPCDLPPRLASRWWLDATTLSQDEVMAQLTRALEESSQLAPATPTPSAPATPLSTAATRPDAPSPEPAAEGALERSAPTIQTPAQRESAEAPGRPAPPSVLGASSPPAADVVVPTSEGAPPVLHDPTAPPPSSTPRLPRAFSVALHLTGVLAVLIAGYFGYADRAESPVTATFFSRPWPLYLWLSTLVYLWLSRLPLVSYDRVGYRRTWWQRISTLPLSVTTVYVAFAGAVLGLATFPPLGERVGEAVRPVIAQRATYAAINLGLLVMYWLLPVREWWFEHRQIRYQQSRPRYRWNVVSATLILGGAYALLLALLFQVAVIGLQLNLLPDHGLGNACLVSWPLGRCTPPGAAAHDPPTLAVLNGALSLLLIFAGTAIRLFRFALDDTTGQGPEETGMLLVLEWSLSRDLRSLARMLIGGSTYLLLLAALDGAWLGASAVQGYLHLRSVGQGCLGPSCPSASVALDLINRGDPMLVLAFGWLLIAVLGPVAAFTSRAFVPRRLPGWYPDVDTPGAASRLRHATRLLGPIGRYLLLTLWIYSLVLSIFSRFVGLPLLGRNPFPQPELATAISVGGTILYFGFSFIRSRSRTFRAQDSAR